MNTYAQGLTLSNSEANIIVKDLTDYRYVLKLHENQKSQIASLKSIIIKQDSTVMNLNKVIALHEQAFTDLFEENVKRQAEYEKAEGKIKKKNKTIAGLVGIQILEIAAIIAIIVL